MILKAIKTCNNKKRKKCLAKLKFRHGHEGGWFGRRCLNFSLLEPAGVSCPSRITVCTHQHTSAHIHRPKMFLSVVHSTNASEIQDTPSLCPPLLLFHPSSSHPQLHRHMLQEEKYNSVQKIHFEVSRCLHHLGYVSCVPISRGKGAALRVEVWKPLPHCRANWIHIDRENILSRNRSCKGF